MNSDVKPGILRRLSLVQRPYGCSRTVELQIAFHAQLEVIRHNNGQDAQAASS